MKIESRFAGGRYLVLALLFVALAAHLAINRSGRAAPPAEVDEGMDWSRVTERDLDIASVFLAARTQGVRVALDSLDRLATRDPGLRGRGHPLAHALGRYAMARGRDLAVLGECTPRFQSGCFHGVLEGYFLQGGTIDTATAADLCAARADARGLERLECWHGLGHGLMVHHAGDFRAALVICDALPSDSARRECLDGIFMERSIRALGVTAINVGDGPAMTHDHGGEAHAGHGGKDADGAVVPPPVDAKTAMVQRREQLCSGLEGMHARSCWTYQPLVLMSLVGMSPAAVLRGCDAAPADAVADCYQGFGKQYVAALSGDVRGMLAACAQGNPARATDCVLGGVEYFTDLEWTIEPGIAFCRQAPGEAKERCYGMIGERLALSHPAPEPIRAACATVEPAFVATCLAGAGLRER